MKEGVRTGRGHVEADERVHVGRLQRVQVRPRGACAHHGAQLVPHVLRGARARGPRPAPAAGAPGAARAPRSARAAHDATVART